MRDLGQQLNSGRGPVKFGKILKIVVIVGVFCSAIIFLLEKLPLGGGSSASVILSDAPRGLKPVGVSGDSIVSEGVDLTTQTASLQDVKYGGEATAQVTRSFGGGVYVLSVEATLPDPVNTNYQVWLVGGGKVLPIDYMRGAKTSWSLNLRDTDKYSGYGGIWITLERTKDDKPEEHVMEGSF